jgi:predicted Ser/Thr protein kinase
MKITALKVELHNQKTDTFDVILKDEARVIWHQVQSGMIREIYFHGENHTAVMILEVPGLGEAEDILSQLPLAREGFIRFEIIPLVPYDGYARLFV